MRRTVPLILVLIASTAHGECYVRSATTNRTAINITAVADVEPLVVPISPTQNKCIVSFRAQVNGRWITAEGERVGPKSISEKDLCASAIDDGRVQILSRADSGRMDVEQNMVCNDQPEIKVRAVRLGERVRESLFHQ